MIVNCSACGATNESSISECQFCGNSLSIQNIDFENKIKSLNDQGNKFKLAEVAFEGENYDEAINYYNACLEIDPNFFEAWYKKGLSMIKTSTIGNFKSKQSISAFKQALNFSPNAENFKKRIKKELFPLVCDYYTIAINHFKEFSSLPNSDHELGEKVIRANETVDFIIENIGLDLDEIKKLYKVIYDSAVIQSKIVSQQALANFGKTPTAPTSTIFKERIHYILNQRLIPLWKNLEPETAPKEVKGCFIATVTMGSYDHPVVVDLRIFRDEWLLKRKWGVQFTNWYYTNGQKAANIIEKSYVLRRLSYFMIVKPIHIVSSFLNKR